jgi:uracil-DNA glycosylase
MSCPKTSVLAEARALLWARLNEPHVAPLVTLADDIARSRGLPTGVGAVPYPDPQGAGVHARVLFLLNDPGDGARVDSGGSGMLCLLNKDQTTRKQLDAIRDSRLERRLTLHWNAIPWPVAPNERDRNIAPAVSALLLLLDTLHSLRGVVALGAYARRVWKETAQRDRRLGGLAYVHSAHPARSSTVDLRQAYRRAAGIAAMD